MALAPNPFLQATPVAQSKPAIAIPLAKAAETSKDSASSFAQVFSKQADPKPAVVHETRETTVKDKPTVASDKHTADAKPAASKRDVADSGKSLPADKAVKKSDADDDKDDADDKPIDPVATDAAPVTPVPDPALIAVVALPAPDPVPVVVVAPPVIEIPAAMIAAVIPQAAPAVDPKAFDPATDPLEGLAAVQVALQQNGKGAAVSPTATDALAAGGDKKTSSTQTNSDSLLTVANNLAVPVDQQATGGAGADAGDKAFNGLIEDGLKDTKSAASDTRVDDFANRLAALSQAVQPKAAAVATAVASPLTQPLAMHQSGWSEAVVDRVMYLSSQNLKSADIQLAPAELGRLDIRVNMAADQQTQITFMSAHVGVREALEGQMSKLRDSFAQQGLGQVDVNVSDQSRGSQGQGQGQQDANQSSRSGGLAGSGSDRSDSSNDSAINEVATAASQPMTVIGSSQVDYYA
ncbi:MAG: flagellar hook-length control protein [Pseudomonas sp.]|jgi:flagellar hook-length control protein FliK|uniref:flagellar hook-length control protein FliK n=1 Tax=Pseudomonas sp. TaxID=306 RepID=UPI002607E7E8|nr:flagellar hook-length control protein FliK [Pseudomonas sp.]MDB6049959.1 flagellar hook-length control protein [Pseudomonas sp.]